ncbi:MAG: type III-B CRISPR module RAMP protein Cmr6, partial [Anaerolineae bacterium]|nr:type III-B CRISPR module RAMP protein Cmr6 [Anaerolineae bacterium]
AIAEVLKFALTGDGERDSKIFESLDDGLIAGNYDNRNEMIPLYRLAFGSQDMGGKAIFHDAVLEQTSNPNQWVFDVDVMTPHYPGYYRDSGATPPSDDQSPVPISFITVAAGCVFRFAVGWRGPKNLEAREFAADLLADALSEFGIGAKTAAGYGVFKKPS